MSAAQYIPGPAGAPGRYFACTKLSATLSTLSCAAQWTAAEHRDSSPCRGCPIGKQHSSEHHGLQPTEPHRGRVGTCLRCGGVGLRLIVARGVCVSCANRQYECLKGRNAKGSPPIKHGPLAPFEVQAVDAHGQHVHHAVEARHDVEAAGVVARLRLRDGERLAPGRAHAVALVAGQGSGFGLVCPSCGTPGMLERVGRHHCTSCHGEAPGRGWRVARARLVLPLMSAGAARAWLQLVPSEVPPVVREEADRWAFVGIGCATCGRGILQVRRGRRGKALSVRCEHCGDHAEG
ncbi:MAG: hypothetical protein JSR41_05145 [Proteobacteria bacterium]|nr:hypothetical protein [Pseudomonadota bacterium]